MQPNNTNLSLLKTIAKNIYKQNLRIYLIQLTNSKGRVGIDYITLIHINELSSTKVERHKSQNSCKLTKPQTLLTIRILFIDFLSIFLYPLSL